MPVPIRTQASDTGDPRDLAFAKLETYHVVGSQAAAAAQLGVALWHKLGCDTGADDDEPLRQALAKLKFWEPALPRQSSCGGWGPVGRAGYQEGRAPARARARLA